MTAKCNTKSETAVKVKVNLISCQKVAVKLGGVGAGEK